MEPVNNEKGLDLHWFRTAKAVLLRPNATIIAAANDDTLSMMRLTSAYLLKFGLLFAIALFLGQYAVGAPLAPGHRIHRSFDDALSTALTLSATAMVSVFLFSLVLSWLAPRFGGVASPTRAFRLTTLASTPVWIGMIPAFLVPEFGKSVFLSFYGVYLLAVGFSPLLQIERQRRLAFGAASIVGFLVVCGAFGTGLFVVAASVDTFNRSSFTARQAVEKGNGVSSAGDSAPSSEDESNRRIREMNEHIEAMAEEERIQRCGQYSAAQISSSSEGEADSYAFAAGVGGC